MIWVYGICDHPELPAPRRRGLAQAPLEGVREGALLAVFTRHAHPLREPAPDALWMHERVVERLMVDRTVLPMRFGSTLESVEDLRRLLAERQAPLVATLARIAGRVELGLRVMEPAERRNGAAAVLTGRDYLMARLGDGRRAERLHEPLAALAAEARRQTPRGGGEVLNSAYLVEPRMVPRFRATVQRLQREHSDLALLCTGPWPPYSFVGGDT